nr:TorF family putative porin [Brevundimonas alba]
MVLTPTAALAQDISGQIGVASQYVGKGIGKSSDEPSLYGSVEATAGLFYAGVFASTAELSQGSDAEIVTTIGVRPEFAGFEFDLSAMNKDFPGSRAGVDPSNIEYQADVSRKLGPVGTRLRVNYTPDGFAATREAWWVEAQASLALDAATKASVALGERTADGGAEYVAWNAGVKRKLSDRIALDVRWYDTDGHDFGEPYEGRLVGSLSLSL